MKPWLLIAVFAPAAALWAQPAPAAKPYLSSPRRALTAPELKDAPDEWIARSLAWAGDILNEYPPAVPEHPVRRAALIRLDDILHIEPAPSKPLVQKFYRARIERAVAEIERTRVTSGMRIWKLYNHGWLVRTPSVSIAFDIVPGAGNGFDVDTPVLVRLAREADVLFLSHAHGDHVNETVASMFLLRNKPVFAPEGLWKDRPIAAQLRYLERNAGKVHKVELCCNRALEVVAYPGHQGADVVNNVHLVKTPEGFTIVQTGDQSGDEGPGSDFDWMAHIGARHKVDVLLPNCWTNSIGRVVRGIDPRLVLTGHENEMGHTVDHREDYTQTYNHLFGVNYPFVVMGWGESFLYTR
jgi:L-ascorbate metabolism protein UlaG (beta-lactamase superfamily)